MVLGVTAGAAYAQTDDVDISDSVEIIVNENLEETEEVETEEVETEEVETEEEKVTATISPDTVLDLGQEVSNFVHQSTDLFKQQGMETKTVIQNCRGDMKDALPSERQDVRQVCRENLDAIKDWYKDLRQTYKETFKVFRENMKILIKDSKGLEVDEGKKAAALANIVSLSENEDKREKIKELQQQMREQAKEERKQLHEQMKKERETAREVLKAEREAMKEAMKEEREMMQKEREALRDAGIESEDEARAAEDAEDEAREAAEDEARAAEDAEEDEPVLLN